MTFTPSEHLFRYEYLEDEDEWPSFLGCACGAPGTESQEGWGSHVDELQRLDRAAVWQAGREALAMATLPGAARLQNPFEEVR